MNRYLVSVFNKYSNYITENPKATRDDCMCAFIDIILGPLEKQRRACAEVWLHNTYTGSDDYLDFVRKENPMYRRIYNEWIEEIHR